MCRLSARRRSVPRSNDAYGDIDNENGNVAQRTASRSQVGEGLVTRRIDDEETRDLEVEGVVLQRDAGSALDRERAHTS